MLEFTALQRVSEDELDVYYQQARELSEEQFGPELRAYYPSNNFPSVSLTGTFCAQNCRYCNKYYLQHMVALTTPEKLEAFAFKLAKKKRKGFLISGGYTAEARLPIEPFLPTLAKIKRETDLIINLHPGLVTEQQAKAIAEAGIDEISFDLIVDDEVIKETINPHLSGEDYRKAFRALTSAGLRVTPHILLGVFYGKLKGEIEALKTAIAFKPKLIVFLLLIPTKGTAMAHAPLVAPELLGKFLIYTRLNHPEIEQSLGCMRVRKIDYEFIALKSGINRIAVPKEKTLALARQKYRRTITIAKQCCTIG